MIKELITDVHLGKLPAGLFPLVLLDQEVVQFMKKKTLRKKKIKWAFDEDS